MLPIIYINLDKRVDRREQIESELRGYKFERFPAIFNEEGIVGCSYSHLGVLKLARDRGYARVLILEDDFQFLVSHEEFEEELKKLDDIEFDVCMISYNLIKSELIGCEGLGLGRVIEAQTASGYIVNAHYYDTLIALYEESVKLLETTKMHWIYANDQIWKQLQKKDRWYYFIKRIGKQRDGYSDNSKCFMSYGC